MNNEKTLNRPLYLRAYFDIFNFIAKKRIKNSDVDLKEVHTLLISVVTTSILMWAYAVTAATTISSPIPGIVGLVCSAVHLYSPVLYRFTKSSFVVCSVMLFAGAIHQSTFAYYSGGLNGVILVWLSVLPFLAGLICGKKGVFFWGSIVFLICSSFLVFQLMGYAAPHLISAKGDIIARALLIFGYIFLTTTVISIYITLHDEYEDNLKAEKERVQGLIRVLCHDLSNPILIIENYVRRISNMLDSNESTEKYIGKIERSVTAMRDISSSVRRMQAAESGKTDLDIRPTSINDCIRYIKFLLEDNFILKEIELVYDFEKYKDIYISVDPVVFKNQVLANILTNSIKFSAPGTKVVIDISMTDTDDIQLNITDSGVGMPKEIIENLFELDRPTSRRGTNGEDGTGFGMMIAKTFMSKFDGDISVRSTEESDHCKDHGTIVSLNLIKVQAAGAVIN
ncbi:MAG: hypothetical protein BM556_16375 [Bacteriovorax sp. MedPE-SWde]|nr:MAG: hypothetical protein BM556_16375 [Bacteriovorax sp. MedPE-SWde]